VVATLDTISRDALVLSPDERVALAYRLLVSVEPDEGGSEQAWENEISRRIQRFDRGDSKSIPAADVFERLRQIAPDK
jgi:putative addiction module component (TIGR02574 family)